MLHQGIYPHAINTLKNQGANNKPKNNEGKLCTSLPALDLIK